MFDRYSIAQGRLLNPARPYRTPVLQNRFAVKKYAELPIDHSHTTLKYQALHAAVEFGHLDSARLLVTMGAKVKERTTLFCKGSHVVFCFLLFLSPFSYKYECFRLIFFPVYV